MLLISLWVALAIRLGQLNCLSDPIKYSYADDFINTSTLCPSRPSPQMPNTGRRAQLAAEISDYGIKSADVGIGNTHAKGYHAHMFNDAPGRSLPKGWGNVES